eukprot:COSAG05_NODE_10721_length_549_cov_1.602222_1_plen_40_part_00
MDFSENILLDFSVLQSEKIMQTAVLVGPTGTLYLDTGLS